MNLIIDHGRGPAHPATTQLIESRLIALAQRERIEHAVVRILERPDARPRFVATVMLRLEGPEIQAAASDHAPRLAVHKALADAEAQVIGRMARRRSRLRVALPALPRLSETAERAGDAPR